MTEWPWQASWRWLWLVPFFGLAWRWVGLNGFSAWRRLPFVAVLGLALAAFGTLLSSHFFPGIGPSLHVAAFAALCLFLFDLWRRPRLGVSWAYHFSLWHLWLLLWIAGSACLVALIVIKTDFHDQIRIQGHAAAVESMMRGNLPPHLQAFPEVALKYHFGGDLVAAILGYTLGLPALQAIDALQVGGWVLANLCLYGLARGLGLSRPFSILALHWVLLAAGWAYLFDPSLAWPDSHLVFRKNLNPGVFSYAFQTPYALGFPLFFTYLASLKEWTLKPDLRRLGLAALILGTLSFFHIAFFFGSLACTLGMLAARPLWGEASWHSALIQAALMLAIALLIAISAGGFFSPSEAYNRSVLAWSWPPGYLRHAPNPRAAPLSLLLTMAWYLSTLGSLLLWALPVCALALRDLRNRPRPLSLYFLLFALGSFLVPQLFHYKLSWDIIKWFTAFQLSFLLLLLLTLAGRVEGRRWLGALLLISAALDTLPSYRMLWNLAVTAPETQPANQRNWFKAKAPPVEPWISYMRSRLRQRDWREMALASPRDSEALSIHSGQSMATLDYITASFGVRPSLLQQRKAEIGSLIQNFTLEKMRAGPIRWLIYRCPEFDRDFSDKSRSAIQAALGLGALLPIEAPSELGCWKIFYLPKHPADISETGRR